MAIKVKEIKDDALIDVKVNKNYYMMLKHTLFYLFNQITDNKEREESLSVVSNGDYSNMDPYQRAFYTVTLMVAEIEKIAKEQELYDEKEVLEPGDEGYVEPTE